MPVPRNKQMQANGQSNGYLSHRSSATFKRQHQEQQDSYSKKKLILLEEDEANRINNNNNSSQEDNNNDKTSRSNNKLEEVFADTQTVSSASHLTNGREEDPAAIFGLESSSSIGQATRDQFAVALLRLQNDLELTSGRLTELEGRLDKSLSQYQQQQKQRDSQAAAAKGKGPLSGENLTNILYLTWPVFVFMAMRAIERRSLAGAKLA